MAFWMEAASVKGICIAPPVGSKDPFALMIEKPASDSTESSVRGGAIGARTKSLRFSFSFSSIEPNPSR